MIIILELNTGRKVAYISTNKPVILNLQDNRILSRIKKVLLELPSSSMLITTVKRIYMYLLGYMKTFRQMVLFCKIEDFYTQVNGMSASRGHNLYFSTKWKSLRLY